MRSFEFYNKGIVNLTYYGLYNVKKSVRRGFSFNLEVLITFTLFC